MKEFDAKDESSHDEFLKWMEDNREGFFLNDRGKEGFMLHKSGCGHMKFKEKVSLTSNKKFCSTDRRELESHAKKHSSKSLEVCRSCAP